MPLILELPDQYGLVMVAASSTFILNMVHQFLTGGARKASGIKYPTTYATDELAAKDPKAYKFNCAQRAHANFIENQGSFLGGLLISGLRFPTTAAALGAVWVVGRLFYGIGYAKNGPSGRLMGAYPSSLADYALRGMAVYTSVMYALGQ